ncbi:MAG: formylglycine-generating enzyme family protein [Magnetococcales bacterium]|nr:formylglycine-generating enzyme family protein [Magnetococcales bacterium]
MNDALQEIRKHLAKERISSARQTLHSIVSQIISRQGWDVWSPEQVRMENDQRMVLTLPKERHAMVCIEVLEPGNLDKRTEINPCCNTPFHILTDGRKWRFFFREKGQQTPNLMFKQLDISSAQISESENVFHAFLSLKEHQEDTPRQRLEKKRALARKRKHEPLRRALPKARQLLARNPQATLVQALNALVKKAGMTFAPDEIRAFVAEVEQDEATSGSGPAQEEKPTESKTWIESVTNMVFIWIPPTTFTMGSPDDEQSRQRNEGPQHDVTLQGYWIAQFPVTKGQWRKVMESGNRRPGRYADQHNEPEEEDIREDDHLPMEHATWEDTQLFIRKLELLGGGESRLRLPTEAEWECAARAGAETRYQHGESPKELAEYAWYMTNSKGRNQPVGKLKPNAWGLYDMLGGVWEWVEDVFSLYSSDPCSDPSGPPEETVRGEPLRIRRGGSYRSNPKACRLARRNHVKVDALEMKNTGCLGFRLAKNG